jgi:hypothetical protein
MKRIFQNNATIYTVQSNPILMHNSERNKSKIRIMGMKLNVYVFSPSIMQQSLKYSPFNTNTTCFGHRLPSSGVSMHLNCCTVLMYD